MKEAMFLLLGTLIGFAFTILHEWLARLRQFRAKMNVVLVRIGETKDDRLEAFYESSRIEVLAAFPPLGLGVD